MSKIKKMKSESIKKHLRRVSERQLVVEPRVWSERQRAYKDPSGDKVAYYFPS